MKEKKITIDGQEFVIKQYNWKEHLSIEQNALQINLDPITGQPTPTMDMSKMKMAAVKFGLKTAPFVINELNLGLQPKNVMEELFKEIDAFNAVSKKKSQQSDKPLEE